MKLRWHKAERFLMRVMTQDCPLKTFGFMLVDHYLQRAIKSSEYSFADVDDENIQARKYRMF